MRSINRLILSVSCLIILSCNNDKTERNSDLVCYNVKLTEKLLSADHEFTSLLKSYQIFKLDAGKDEFLDNFSSLKILNDKIYVLDREYNKAVFIFTQDGHFVNKICKVGKGPGEYLQVADFDVDNKTGDVLVFDWDKGEIIDYDITGRYVLSVKLNKRYSSFAKYNDKYLTSKHYSKDKQDFLLTIHNSKGKLLNSFFSALDYQNCSTLLFRFGGNFFYFNEEYRYFIPETDTVYRVTANQMSSYLVFEHPVYNKDNSRPIIYSYSENESYVLFKTEINNIPYDIFYNKITKEITPISIFKLEEEFTKLPINTLLCISGDYLYALVNKNSMVYIQSLISSGKIKNEDVKSFVETYGAFNLLIRYELK